ncbi:glycine betaine ABC transporter substrate-binding protein [Leucobacter triazinivorans]|uniref:Glycine betaine ABC transporter substrate-binding protein n=1 Tax=Leucobacter triazinivorans TaxID=1784719 RepID=A0A4P6KBR7_9MICO|nr:glycine betaine ABC transporter substrate-binding protein [Leucobacter triazinivorans]QBE47543.1 glycine betaine ABC transporter substrate-binding protein [Leucobacter triazinivorans]
MKKKMTGFLALVAASGLALTACSSDGAGDGGESGGEAKDTITLGYIDGWTDGQSMTYLVANQLEKLDYDVEIQPLTDNGPMYAGLANGDIDIWASAWPEVTQASYWEEFGDDLESHSVWYDNAVLTIAVPSYSSIDSMEDLAGNADMFGNEIIGIEPGAGLTEVTETSMMPAYGLDDWTLATSSTAAMLTVLGDAIDNQEEVVVTLWRPFWAYSSYDLKDLEDPKGAMGDPEGLHIISPAGFGEEHPEIAELLEGIQLSDDAYGALESLITSDEYVDDSEGAVEAWLADHSDAFSTIVTE